MGVRQDDRLAVTVAMPLSCQHIGSEAAYFARKEEILDALSSRFTSAPFAVDWQLNCLDRRGQGTEGVYLTLTGTSAEDADSGQVGEATAPTG
jgi:S-adenosylmethionine synthetase